MKIRNFIIPIILCCLFPNLFAISADKEDQQKAVFKNADQIFRPNPLWFWNNSKIDKIEAENQLTDFKEKCGYGGVSILPFGDKFSPEYLSEDYFDLYGDIIKKATTLQMKMWIYDEYGFPSGSAGAYNADSYSRFGEKYPEHTLKRLDKTEYRPTPGKNFITELSQSKLMAAIAMDTVTMQRINLKSFINNHQLIWNTPKGNWKIMIFTCEKGSDKIVDYLDPTAVRKFIAMTHEKYYKRFGKYFGNTLVGTFFDEPTLYRENGRCWTKDYNEKFEKKYGFSPDLLYPALWYDIGKETQSARNYLFGFRAELYATGYMKEVNDWSHKHGLLATGHQDNEEIINPVGTSADLMKCFKYLEVPGIDKIGGNRPAERFYKIISSAANNWNHSLVMSETYGDMGNISWEQIFSIAMDQYSKGINLLIPHAVWYDTEKVTFRPELSHRNPLYADSLKAFTDYLTRLNVLLQNDARTVNNVAVLYPIHTLQGEHYFDGPLGYYKGGVEIPDMDYIDLGVMLTDKLGRDFSYLHPDVLSEKCSVSGKSVRLNNSVHSGNYSYLVFPSCKTISTENLKKAVQFYKSGGIIVFTTQLPSKSAETGNDTFVQNTIKSLFSDCRNIGENGKISTNKKGGKVYYIPTITDRIFSQILNDRPDEIEFKGKPLRHIHKTSDKTDIYFFANPSAESITTEVILNDKKNTELWDPHTGTIERVPNKNTLRLVLEPYKSIFIVTKQ